MTDYDDELDHPDSLEDDASDDDPEIFALFAEALDPESDVTVEQREAEYRELLG